MFQQTPVGCERFAKAVWDLYASLEPKFGSERAWEFVMNFYKGAANG